MAAKMKVTEMALTKVSIDILNVEKRESKMEDGEVIEWQEVGFTYDGDILKGTTSIKNVVKKGKATVDLTIAPTGGREPGLKFKLAFPEVAQKAA